MNTGFLDPAVATVPTACGIETSKEISLKQQFYDVVATVPTACGIETGATEEDFIFVEDLGLQQYLPLAVLKPFLILAICL